MRELRTLKRTRHGSRVRSVQGRLSIEFGDEDETGGDQLKVEPPARSSGFRRPTKASALNQERSPVYGQMLRFSTHWPIAAWWQVGPSSGVNSGVDAPTVWKRLACPGVMRRPKPSSRSGTITAMPLRPVVFDAVRQQPRTVASGRSGFPVVGNLAAPMSARSVMTAGPHTHTSLPFHQGLETNRAEPAIVLVNHSPATRPRGRQPTERFQPGRC